jgi:thiol-disulfide isomerase/thioredoxin
MKMSTHLINRRAAGVALLGGVAAAWAGIPRRQQSLLTDGGAMPELEGAIGWLNSPSLQRKSLRGKVVLVDFWTYTCINSLRPLPYVKSWHAKYKDAGLVVVGVHTPEFSFERDRRNVEEASRTLHVLYPVAIDSEYKIWNAFKNQYWPAQYLIDARGRIRYRHDGEGEYVELERMIQNLLKENGATGIDGKTVTPLGEGVEAATDLRNVRSPETYIGYRQATHFASPERLVHDSRKAYSLPAEPSLNQWGLGGTWTVGPEAAILNVAPGKVVFRFHSRDLHLVLAPTSDGKPVRFKIALDGKEPADNHGSDSAPDGAGQVREPRLYQLIRQKDQIRDRTFEIEFLDPGAQALDFTFG